ncbi:transcriptional regulator [Planomonospora parontospora subsp. parontospora]|uniref:Transcriptional regulator n=2 Tax=Planomonospora parontospora TaxID=58119 RepID=A0AA37F7P4_9ACTN|nr:helix-turn-helix transcriptional regulator [Planomonospora parontospora]GGK91040.1 transcriptional regulator [Planomonospora parontospora]GII11922.1 transcriptional regulator [Planomonospora parontospora subsp. parontospora]
MSLSSSNAQQALDVLGARLRQIRLDARLTGRDLARLAGWHSSKVSRIEHGRRSPSAEDVTVWCQQCDAHDQAVDLIASLQAIQGMFVEWRDMERSGLKVAQESVVPLWERTRHFRIYSSQLIPGPLQTGAYIAALLTSLMQRRGLPDDVDDAVRVRVEKQRIIEKSGRQFAVILEESVLRHPIGGTEVMIGQLGHLLTVSTLPSISLGIIPLGVDRSSMWPPEGFFMFDTAEVTVELVSGHLTITQPHEIAMYAATFAELAELAVHGKEARTLITKAIAALDG